MRYYIYKGERPSEGALNLRAALSGVALRPSGSTYNGRGDRALINWGSSNQESRRLWGLSNPTQRLNNPDAVSIAGNKLSALRALGAESIPIMPYWERNGDFEDIFTYVQNGGRVYARRELRGHSGAGITIIMNEGDRQQSEVRGQDGVSVYLINNATTLEHFHRQFDGVQLFTQGIQGVRREWRCHVFRGRAILLQLKLRSRDGFPGSNSLIRNLENGWIYSVNYDPTEFPEVEEMQRIAISAVEIMNLDFGAVDLIHRPRSSSRPEQNCVLEINTAPGLEEGASTLRVYTEAIQQWGRDLDALRLQA